MTINVIEQHYVRIQSVTELQSGYLWAQRVQAIIWKTLVIPAVSVSDQHYVMIIYFTDF